MSKVLIKMKYDFNDADYLYGIHVMKEENWNKIWKAYEKGEVSVVFESYERIREFEKLKKYFEVTKITDEQYEELKRLQLTNFGEDLPTVYLEDIGELIEFDEDGEPSFPFEI